MVKEEQALSEVAYELGKFNRIVGLIAVGIFKGVLEDTKEKESRKGLQDTIDKLVEAIDL